MLMNQGSVCAPRTEPIVNIILLVLTNSTQSATFKTTMSRLPTPNLLAGQLTQTPTFISEAKCPLRVQVPKMARGVSGLRTMMTRKDMRGA